MDEKINGQRGIQSISVGLKIIEVMRAAESSQPLAVISRSAGIPPSSCHRYLVTFMESGYVVQEPRSGRYGLGPGIVQAGLAALRRAVPVTVGMSACELLAQKTGLTAQLSIWSDVGPIIVGWRVGRVPIATNLSVGSRLPVTRSATGNVFLAHLPKDAWIGLVAVEGVGGDRVKEITDAVLARGHGRVFGDQISILHAAAAPLLDARGKAVAAIALLGLAGEITDEAVADLIHESRLSSAALGFTGITL